MKVKIKKLLPEAKIPSYAKPGDAGMDLTVLDIIRTSAMGNSENREYKVTYGFGIAVEIPLGYVGLIFPRSSVRDQNLLLTNSVGVVDSGYRGELQATFIYTSGIDSHKYKVGDKAAQLIIIPYPQIEFEEGELTETERGNGGFGHTGK